uniref:Uncharacterized protein n=1 Tax=Caenorhabditis japonica TaxID=281687 RepID=A0A8R1EWN9_CAEJA
MVVDKEREFVQEWVEHLASGQEPVALDQLVSLYGYALLGLDEPDVKAKKKIVKPEMDRTMDRRDRDDNHSNYYVAEGAKADQTGKDSILIMCNDVTDET